MDTAVYTVLVFMSAYNGEKYLDKQMRTILNQENVNIRVLVRDDGSRDNTLNLLKAYEAEYENVNVIRGKNIGYAASFLKLIYDECYEKADFYAFSDQDDIWDEDKIISGVRLMPEHDKPMFYYSSQRIVDEKGDYLRDEICFRKVQKYSKYSASMVPLTRGCTQVWNNRLHEIILARRHDININEIYSHDFWISLVAFWKAKMVYDDVPHMGYRQTGNNISGAYKSKTDHLKYMYRKALVLAAELCHIREKTAKQIENAFGAVEGCELLTAHYRENISKKMQLLFSRKYKKGLSLKWKIFTTILVICNRL